MCCTIIIESESILNTESHDYLYSSLDFSRCCPSSILFHSPKEMTRQSNRPNTADHCGSQYPNSGWQPTMYGQNWSPSPQNPNWLQHLPKVDPRQFTLLPQRPSVLLRWPAGSVKLGPLEVVVLLVVRMVLVLLVVLVVDVVMRVVLDVVVVGPPAVVVTLPAGPPGMPGTPRQAPNSLRHPAPQNSMVEPHQKN